MPEKVLKKFIYLFCAFLPITQFSCRDTAKSSFDYEAEFIADSSDNSFINEGRLDMFMQLSRDIIKARLDNYGFSEEDYNLEINDNRIKVNVYGLLPDSAETDLRSLSAVGQLVAAQGSFRIYETFENMESQVYLARLDSAMYAFDTAASVYNHIFVPEYYEDGQVIYHPTPVVGYVPEDDTASFYQILQHYRPNANLPDEFILLPMHRAKNNLRGIVAVRRHYRDSRLPLIDQSYVRNVEVHNSGGSTMFRIELNETGRELFTLLSLDNENRSLAIVLDGRVLFHPRLTAPVTDGVLEFSSSMPYPQARALAVVVNMKQLPLNFTVEEKKLTQ